MPINAKAARTRGGASACLRDSDTRGCNTGEFKNHPLDRAAFELIERYGVRPNLAIRIAELAGLGQGS